MPGVENIPAHSPKGTSEKGREATAGTRGVHRGCPGTRGRGPRVPEATVGSIPKGQASVRRKGDCPRPANPCLTPCCALARWPGLRGSPARAQAGRTCGSGRRHLHCSIFAANVSSRTRSSARRCCRRKVRSRGEGAGLCGVGFTSPLAKFSQFLPFYPVNEAQPALTWLGRHSTQVPWGSAHSASLAGEMKTH